MMTSSSQSVVRYLCSAGGASVGLVRHRTENRMLAVLQFTTCESKKFQVELTLDDVRGIGHDIVMLLSADQAEVAAWWRTLADGSDGRPRAPKPSAPHAAEHSSAAGTATGTPT